MAIKKFCPNRECVNHRLDLTDESWLTPNGFYSTRTFGVVRRYKCLDCNRGFSDQTFSLDYYAKMKIDYPALLLDISSSMNDRAIAREMEVSPGTIKNRTERLARQAIAFHTNNLSHNSLREDLVADGFESFCVSQYFPNNLNILVGKESQLVYFFNYTLLRRKGRMTAAQKVKREELEKEVEYPKKELENNFKELALNIKKLMENSEIPFTQLYTDEKKEYKRALEKIVYFDEENFEHVTISSKKARIKKNPLFAVNYMDREIRKDLANHRRETVCHARNVNNMMNRLAVYFHWHNYIKPFRIKDPVSIKRRHAEEAGMFRPLFEKDMEHIYIKRSFLSFCHHVKGTWKMIWKRMFQTPLKKKEEYLPAYGCA
jgi:transposase-like protein